MVFSRRLLPTRFPILHAPRNKWYSCPSGYSEGLLFKGPTSVPDQRGFRLELGSSNVTMGSLIALKGCEVTILCHSSPILRIMQCCHIIHASYRVFTVCCGRHFVPMRITPSTLFTKLNQILQLPSKTVNSYVTFHSGILLDEL